MQAIASLLGFLFLLVGSAAAQAAPAPTPGGYVLGPQDKLKIAVYDWRKSVGELHQWTALSGKFVVGPGGILSLPLIGNVPAGGMTTEALAQEISARLQKQVGLSEPADTSIEVIKYRPFYILGSVSKPGAYAFRPGLDVLEAISIAGGLFRPTAESYEGLSRDTITARGTLSDLRARIEGLLARLARFKAEAAGSATIAFPPALTARRNDPAIAELMRNEEALFEVRRESLTMQSAAYTQLRDILQKEVEELQKKAANQDHEIKLLNAELGKYGWLVEKGLGVNSREFQLQQDAAAITGQRLDLNNSLLRAQEEIAKADESLVDLREKRRQEVLLELQQTRNKLSQLRAQAQTAKQLIVNSEITGPELVEGQRHTEPIYKIMRREGGALREIAASAKSAVEPGDTITVTRKPPSFAIGTNASASPVATQPAPILRDPGAPPAAPPAQGAAGSRAVERRFAHTANGPIVPRPPRKPVRQTARDGR